MTIYEKNAVNELIAKGHGYKKIASITGLPVNSVKSYCRRNKDSAAIISYQPVCKNCGIPVVQMPGKKAKLFCSDSCRMKWWNSHRDRVRHKNIYSFTCPHCGKEFTSKGSPNRKYCSRECAALGRRKDITGHGC